VKEAAARLDSASPVGRVSTKLVAVLGVVLRGIFLLTQCGSIYQLNISVGTVELRYNKETAEHMDLSDEAFENTLEFLDNLLTEIT
jgi:hypothetical protein